MRFEPISHYTILKRRAKNHFIAHFGINASRLTEREMLIFYIISDQLLF